VGDIGLTVGASPGVRVYFGVFAWMDFPSSTLASPTLTRNANLSAGGTLSYTTPSYPVVSGTQIYIGPMLGMTFGH
jgi:hypothetical protein